MRARYDVATGKIVGISGTVDGGAGLDTIFLSIGQNTTIASAVLPLNFERLGFDLSNNAVVTVAPGLATGTGLALIGSGTLVNQAALNTNGAAVTATATTLSLSFVNQGAHSRLDRRE